MKTRLLFPDRSKTISTTPLWQPHPHHQARHACVQIQRCLTRFTSFHGRSCRIQLAGSLLRPLLRRRRVLRAIDQTDGTNEERQANGSYEKNVKYHSRQLNRIDCCSIGIVVAEYICQDICHSTRSTCRKPRFQTVSNLRTVIDVRVRWW